MYGSFVVGSRPGKGLLGLRSEDNVGSGPEKIVGSQIKRYVWPSDLKKYWLPKAKTTTLNCSQTCVGRADSVAVYLLSRGAAKVEIDTRREE